MATIDTWRGPGSGGTIVAPNTFWVEISATATNWQAQCQFFNSSGGLVTVNASFSLWDVTSNAAVFTQTLTGVNTISWNANMNTVGHRYAYAILYNGGTSCDHCLCSTTSIGANALEHPIFRVRRSGVWHTIAGHELRIRRSGAWVIVNGGVRVRRSGAWVQP